MYMVYYKYATLDLVPTSSEKTKEISEEVPKPDALAPYAWILGGDS